MELGRCKSCKHFYVGGREPEGGHPTSSWLQFKNHSPHGQCARWLAGYGISFDEVPMDGCLVEDDEGWGMIIGPDFGCVLWEPSDGDVLPTA